MSCACETRVARTAQVKLEKKTTTADKQACEEQGLGLVLRVRLESPRLAVRKGWERWGKCDDVAPEVAACLGL